MANHAEEARAEEVTEALTDFIRETIEEQVYNIVENGQQEDWLLANGWTPEDIIERLAEKGLPHIE
jgi:hypothetical protein